MSDIVETQAPTSRLRKDQLPLLVWGAFSTLLWIGIVTYRFANGSESFDEFGGSKLAAFLPFGGGAGTILFYHPVYVWSWTISALFGPLYLVLAIAGSRVANTFALVGIALPLIATPLFNFIVSLFDIPFEFIGVFFGRSRFYILDDLFLFSELLVSLVFFLVLLQKCAGKSFSQPRRKTVIHNFLLNSLEFWGLICLLVLSYNFYHKISNLKHILSFNSSFPELFPFELISTIFPLAGLLNVDISYMGFYVWGWSIILFSGSTYFLVHIAGGRLAPVFAIIGVSLTIALQVYINYRSKMGSDYSSFILGEGWTTLDALVIFQLGVCLTASAVLIASLWQSSQVKKKNE